MQSTEQFTRGMKKAMPIALGYFPVSFTFGVMATTAGVPPLVATLISLTNFTSAGQFAGTQLMVQQAMLFEIALTTLVINIRYMLMSVAISQKLESMELRKKLLLAFGITDETFALTMLQEEAVSFYEMLGMIIGPYIGWGIGTMCGAFASTFMPYTLQEAMGIALYAMFIALLLPGIKNSRSVRLIVLFTIIISLVFWYTPWLNQLSEGWKIILTTIIGSGMGAIFFPIQEEAFT